MSEKHELEAEVESGSAALFHSAISLHRALMEIEQGRFEEGLDDLEECSERLDDAIETYERLTEQARDALLSQEDLQAGVSQEFFETLHRRGQLEGLFYEDDEQWAYVTGSVATNDPLANYEKVASLIADVRNQVDGLIRDIEMGRGPVQIVHATWRAMTAYMRAVNLGQMIAFVNTHLERRREQMASGG
ncbi:hypothetical protein BRC81_01190 [Halobacteriales archaeon QS_1_68_20]|nr:MAG: hypothetical protein BRC81_01190 [Halobacteriales archaeon QS_1_68_20]